MKPIFLEIIMAPKFSEGALEVLCTKKNLRLLEVDMTRSDVHPMQYVSVNGGLLAQELDVETKRVEASMTVTKARPDAAQLRDLEFAWRIVKHVKSNAIVVVKEGQTLGVGAGQMNRIGSAEIALKEAQAKGATEGLVMASDGFFPFDDCVTHRRRQRCRGDRAARRFGARRGFDPQGRRNGRGDALHGDAPFQTLR